MMNLSEPSSLGTLILQMKRNDPDAWRRFLDEYGPRIRTWAIQFLPNDLKHDWEDIGQELFIRLIRNLSEFELRSEGQTYGFLKTTVYRIIRDMFLRGRDDSRPRTTDNLPEEDRDSPNLDDLVANKELVHVALGELSPDHREVIVLRHFEGLSFVEIAALKGESVAAVCSRYRRAMELLRNILLLHRAIAELPPDDRQVVVLHDFQKRPFNEIAELTGETEDVVRLRYRRAKVEQRKIVARMLVEEECGGGD